MKRFLKKIYFELEGFVCTVMFIIMLAVLFLQVIMRFVFNNSNAWSEELARYLFIYVAYLAASLAVLKKRHVRIDAIEYLWPKPLRKPTAMLGELICIVFIGVLVVKSAIYVYNDIYLLGSMSIALKCSMWGWWSSLPVGCALIEFRLIVSFIEDFIIKRPLIKEDVSEEEVSETEKLLKEVGE